MTGPTAVDLTKCHCTEYHHQKTKCIFFTCKSLLLLTVSTAWSTTLICWQFGFHRKLDIAPLWWHVSYMMRVAPTMFGVCWTGLRWIQGVSLWGSREAPGWSRMGNGRFSLFTLDLCPAMLNPSAFLSSQDHHLHFSPCSRVMEWGTLGSQWLIQG